ncbi:MAG: M43 family zinc metalloprotease [Leadbetterella sp.]
MIKIIKVVLLVLCITSMYAQEGVKRCASGEIRPKSRHSGLIEKNEKNINYRLQLVDESILKIPIVVHIIHSSRNGVGTGNNISENQIRSQIDVLNEDYRRKEGSLGFNTNPRGVDMKIEFNLANVDPKGNPTNGIVRVYNEKSEFDVLEDQYQLSDLSYWDSSKYLNIWVTSLADNYLGYAEFPSGELNGLETNEIDARIDGVIMDHTAFGKKTGTANRTNGLYIYGRSLTHEIGHWLGLIHIWGDEDCGDDYVGDTPTCEGSNIGRRCEPRFSNCKGTRTQNMIENYMDYTPDSCMNVFTIDQSIRVRKALELSSRRKALIEAANLELPKVEKLTVKILENPSSTLTMDFLVLVEKPRKVLTITLFSQSGKRLEKFEYQNFNSQKLQLSRAKYRAGMYFLRIESDNDTSTHRLIVN